MTDFDYDLFVIGGGSGGVRAARMSASHGARVAIAEEYRYGGTCVIRGCVPKKLLVYASHFRDDFEDARGFGWTVGEHSFSWPALIAAKDKEIARLETAYRALLEKAGATVLAGRARIVDPHTVEIGGERITARYLLVATGGRPFVPEIPGRELGIVSNDAFHLSELPRRIVVVGGGYIAVEFAGIWNGLGAETTLLYRGAEILRGFDRDVRSFLHAEIQKKGVQVQCGVEVAAIERRAGAIAARLTNGETRLVDAVMFATGRVPNTVGLGLEAAGVELAADGSVRVDAHSRTNVPSIYAVGDVTHRLQLTPVAIREGAAVAATLFGGKPTVADHDDVPTAVFSQPPIGTVGLSEEKALERYPELEIYKTDFRPMKATLSGSTERTLMKLIVDRASQRVVGAHMVGADAPEIIQGIGIALKAGLTKADFDATVGIHPTAAEEFVTLRDRIVVTREPEDGAARAAV
ncbi:MAG: glutathione-disulfide reductase [Burkholderiales bacterium]|jgi:glutathione reductase (NADPH)|nr:glutathione-disulfide reductase [Burkholderiales bacterium]